MRSINVSISHDDNLAIAKFLGVECALILLFVANPSTQSSDHSLNLLVGEYLG